MAPNINRPPDEAKVKDHSGQPRKQLRIVEPHHELSGKFPRGFERAVRSCSSGDAPHRGLLFCTTTLARRALRHCLPPSLQASALEFCAVPQSWADGDASLNDVKQARSRCYEATAPFQRKTLEVLGAWLPEPHGPFDEHVNSVARRYIGLSVVHTLNAVLMCCDGVVEVPLLLEVPKEVAAAIAYHKVALGGCRSPELRQAALANAEWEAKQVLAAGAHPQSNIAVQLFHEYLGVQWKNHADAQRLYLEQFVTWAVP